MTYALHELLDRSAESGPNRVAVEESGSGAITYGELARLTDRARDRLAHWGVRPGDRVGVCMTKSADAVAALFGAMKAGAAYVPVDPTAPPSRNAYIMHNCAVKAIFVEARLAPGLVDEFESLEFRPKLVLLDGVGAGAPLARALSSLDASDPASHVATAASDPSRLAYILYTSGSTGKPKGVMLSHGNATPFVDWCSELFEPTAQDRFSSHAPFHFDLSILDIYVSIKHGAALVLIEEGLGKDPARLAPWIAEKKLTMWYSAPSILSLLAQFGSLDAHDYTSLRIVNFAGEVFPIKYLRLLKSFWPSPRYLNLYGPTETNVCTWHEAPDEIPDDQTEPLLIGRVCPFCRGQVVDEANKQVAAGAEGELCIAGPNVLQGYWELPERTAHAFLPGLSERWYRTGDIVIEQPDGAFRFLGRRDRMVKKRGYRIELGEIEAALYRHAGIHEAAVVAISDDSGVRIKAFYSSVDGGRLSIIELKTFCSKHLPLYMVPDVFVQLDVLPKTSTDKVDYQGLIRQ